MKLNRTMLVCALALGSLALGCSDKCKSVCEDQRQCSDHAAGLPDGMDCDKFCDDRNAVSDASKCSKEFDDFNECEEKVQDKCDAAARGTCNAQESAWSNCYGTYCQQHPNDKDCKKYFSDFGIASGST